MPVFYKHKLIHIHIPKTAGTAIETYFHDIGDMKWGPISWVGEATMHGRWYELQHLSLTELRALSNAAFDDYISFAVVRNPYTRLISDYLWRRWFQYPDSATQFFDSFETFLKAIPKNINTNWLDHMRGADKKWANFLIHIRPQYQYVSDSEGHCLVDEILKFERLHVDLARLLKRYGLSTNWIKSPQIRDLKEYYNRAQLDLVNEIYAKDFTDYSYYRL
ncbi:sulfotransferase family 2 domain-containing protein [candidate division CSSED10-310 bacterium]|uniref:Sulfotransferase family 2 domain-containing protein n=1 Tax=candidate division CSSED10-310 bacterium TaxID=2855610 RepID=A0ABV6Z1G6_UNCC1